MASDTATLPQEQTNDPSKTITLKDGRSLTYARYGAKKDPKSIPVFYFNGTPGCHLEGQLVDEPAQKLGIPLISTDRPGFGRSSWQDNRTLLNWAKDIIELADYLEIPKFGVLGLSGGGPYALACLHEISRERLVAVTIVSGMYPISFGISGMMMGTRAFLWIAGWSTWLAEKLIDLTMARPIRNSDREKMIKLMEKQAAYLPQPEADKQAMRDVINDSALTGGFLDSMKESLRLSSRGCAWEFWLFASDWGFKIEEVDPSRLTIWHGGLDVNVPVGMPDKFVELQPSVEFRRMDEDGHVSLIVRHREEILSNFLVKLQG